MMVEEVKNQLERGEHWTVLDVREREEYRAGHLEGALSLPRGFLELRVEEAGVEVDGGNVTNQ